MLPLCSSLALLSLITPQYSADATTFRRRWQQPQNSCSIYFESQAKKTPPSNRENKRLPNTSIRVYNKQVLLYCNCLWKKPSHLQFNYKEQLDTWHQLFIERQLRFWSNFWALLTKPVPPAPFSACTGLDSVTHCGIFHLSPNSIPATKGVHACFWLQRRDGEHSWLPIKWIRWPRTSSALAMTQSLTGDLCYSTSICTPEGDWHAILASVHLWRRQAK